MFVSFVKGTGWKLRAEEQIHKGITKSFCRTGSSDSQLLTDHLYKQYKQLKLMQEAHLELQGLQNCRHVSLLHL